MEEIWKVIKDYEGFYEVSNFGRVKSLNRMSCQNHRVKEKFLKHLIDTQGYLQVDLCKNGKRELRLIHQLVLETFVGPKPIGMVSRHLDGNPQNNHISNLNCIKSGRLWTHLTTNLNQNSGL